MPSLTLQRSKQWLEEKGWHVGIVEQWNQWSRTRRDLYGLMDLVAIRHDLPGVWGVNAVDDGGVQQHIRKYLNGWTDEKKDRTYGPNPHLPVWLACGNRFSIFGWGKRNSAGYGSRKVWTLRVTEFVLNKQTHAVETKEVANIETPS